MRGLRAFCAAARHQSFREAAEELHLTASAVSHQIKHLETELGKRLFARNSRSLFITEFGQAFYDDLKPILDTLDESISSHTQRLTRTSMLISVKPFFASEVLVPKLPVFSELYPGLDINVDTSGDTEFDADFAIRMSDRDIASEHCDRLFPIRLIAVSTPDFYDSVKVKSGRIVSEFPIIVHDSRPNAWQQWQRSSRIRLPAKSKIIRLDSMIAVARAAEQGLGAALVPVNVISRWLASQTLVQLFDHELATKDAYYLESSPLAKDDVALQAFRDWVLQELVLDGSS